MGLYTTPDKPAGLETLAGPGGPPVEQETYQCPHCGGHWKPTKGSGRPHVWCGPCHAYTCSEPLCLRECYPIEKRFDDISKHGRLILPA